MRRPGLPVDSELPERETCPHCGAAPADPLPPLNPDAPHWWLRCLRCWHLWTVAKVPATSVPELTAG